MYNARTIKLVPSQTVPGQNRTLYQVREEAGASRLELRFLRSVTDAGLSVAEAYVDVVSGARRLDGVGEATVEHMSAVLGPIVFHHRGGLNVRS